jgi:hypothetical protein
MEEERGFFQMKRRVCDPCTPQIEVGVMKFLHS